VAGVPVREVVYLSEGKLKGFLPEPRRTLPAVKMQAGISLVGVTVEKPVPDGARDLRRHLERVEKEMARDALWYTEPELTPGSWVMFEALLNWVTLRGRYRDLVLFVDSSPESGHQSEADPTIRRLLLHGSARHLLGGPPPQIDGPALTDLGSGGHSAGTLFVTNAGHVVSALTHSRDPLESESDEGNPLVSTAPLPSAGIRDLLAALDAENSEINTSALVAGYARVSALLPETATAAGCLVASPLIVEYVN
jgi:hypothetical protein